MALAQFTRQFWFPSGVLAASIPARIFPLNSNALAALWTDATGTVALPNPLTTDVNGVVAFWAEEGEYWIHIDAETFRFSVGSPDIDLYEVVAGSMSTGVVSGGDLSVNGSNPAAIDINPLVGYVVDEITDPRNPAVTRVATNAVTTVAMDAGALARTVTFWLMSGAGVVTQQATTPTNEQRRTHLVLGVTAQIAGAIFYDQSLPTIIAQPANQLADLMDALGPFSVTGNMITPNGVNLSLNQSAGTIFARAFNHYAGPTVTRNPHLQPSSAQTPAQFKYVTATSTTFGALTSVVDVANFDSGGVITPVGGGAGSSTIHRLWISASNTAADQLTMQYGQVVYTSLSAAVDAIGQSGHVPNPLLFGNAALLAYIVVTRTATNLGDTAQARIIMAGKFDTP